ncbi:MAG: 50S ribosomal protein L3 [Candidatus ainarchaeum sp.]|nr:50S ribosomal protein L3 [Candidatus ainarchaeum sp.]
MTDIRRPRRGSMAHRPRKRAYSQNARVYWQDLPDKRVLGFAGYKVGMTHVAYVDDTESPTKGQEIVSPATIIEVPPIMVYGVRCYRGNNSVGDILSTDKKVLGLAGFGENPSAKQKGERAKIDDATVDDARLLVFAMPAKTKMGKKHIEKMELGVGGKDGKEKLEFCKSFIGKELRISEVFKNGEHIDVVSVSIGKGWQGAVKRFGISIQRRKATGKRRHVGTLGQWHPAYVLYTVPQAGQTGYHQRTEMNKRILKMGQKPEEINPSAGFAGYGFVRNDYVVLKGSVPGPVKRLVKLRLAVRSAPGGKEPQVSYIATR